MLRERSQLKVCDNAEVILPALQRGEEIRVIFRVRIHDQSTGKDNFEVDHVVASPASLW